MVQEYGRYFGMASCCLRGGCLTGPSHSGVELHGFLSYLVKCNLEGSTYKIFGYKGKQVRDNIHSEDVARFIDCYLEDPYVGEVYNIGGGHANSCSILEAFQICQEISGKKQIFEYLDENRIGDHICYYGDLSKIKKHYPKFKIRKSLEQTIREIILAKSFEVITDLPHKSPKVLLVTETPPGTPNGFGVTLKALFKEIEHNVLYTDASFNNHGEKNGFLFGHVPYHRSKKAFFKFISGRIPEWRGIFSILWLKKSIKENFDLVYAFFYSLSCLRFASWIAEKKGLPLIAHLADHSDEFHNSEASRILKSAGRFVCITKDMRDKYELMLGRKDIEVLHNGAENECFEIPSPQNLCFSENNPFRLTFIGGLFEYCMVIALKISFFVFRN